MSVVSACFWDGVSVLRAKLEDASYGESAYKLVSLLDGQPDGPAPLLWC